MANQLAQQTGPLRLRRSAVVIALMLTVGMAACDSSSDSNAKPAASDDASTDETADGGEPAAVSSDPPLTTAGPASFGEQITWGGTSERLGSTSDCHSTAIVTITIVDGAQYAGLDAVVVFYGDVNFPDRPQQTFTVGADGSFDVEVVTTKCAEGERGRAEGVALLSVDGNTNVFPTLDILTA